MPFSAPAIDHSLLLASIKTQPNLTSSYSLKSPLSSLPPSRLSSSSPGVIKGAITHFLSPSLRLHLAGTDISINTLTATSSPLCLYLPPFIYLYHCHHEFSLPSKCILSIFNFLSIPVLFHVTPH